MLESAIQYSDAAFGKGLNMKVLVQRATAFLNTTYPLSDAGLRFRETVRAAVSSGNAEHLHNMRDELPSVEQPRSELYADLSLNYDERALIFGRSLVNVQVTKGCRHACTFCAASASEQKKQHMPFEFIVKAGEQMRWYEGELRLQWEDWIAFARRKTGFFHENKPTFATKDEGRAYHHAQFEAQKTLWDDCLRHPLHTLLPFQRYSTGEVRKPFFPPTKWRDIDMGWYQIGPVDHAESELYNYYDSDPFDYRTTSILHIDGSPANYGDVVNYLASDMRPVYISTAGWPLDDHVALAAAATLRDVARQNPKHIFKIKLSVNPTEVTARQNLDKYLEQVIETHRALGMAVRQRTAFWNHANDEESLFYRRVIIPFKKYMGNVGLKINVGRISYFSGALATEESRRKDRDIMACMPGIHIWPDGRVAEQFEDRVSGGTGVTYIRVVRGRRPRPIGIQLY